MSITKLGLAGKYRYLEEVPCVSYKAAAETIEQKIVADLKKRIKG